MRFPTVLAVLATTALVAACGGTTGGTATTGTTATSAPNTGTGTTGGTGDTTPNGAPKVKTPLDATKAAAAPCGLLSAAQLQTLGMAGVKGEEDTTALGAACGFSDTNGPSGQRVNFTFVAGEGGLDFLYQSKSTYDLFEPQPPVQGHPALLNEPTDDRKDGKCSVVVGLSDTKILTTSVQMRMGSNPAPRFADPCGVATQAADLALISIKGGS